MVAQACSRLGLKCVHEVEKCHPADWRNPGRVKVQIQLQAEKEKEGKWLNPEVRNRESLRFLGTPEFVNARSFEQVKARKMQTC